MNDDSLRAAWISGRPIDKVTVMTAVHAALTEDRAVRDKERWFRIASVFAIAVLCPALFWCAAFGRTPLVRGGYALMAAGSAVLGFAEWMYLDWSRKALPGPADARSQLHRTAFLLSSQAWLLRSAPLWCAPIFIGTALVGAWVFREVGHAAGYLLWAIVGTGWLMTFVIGITKGARLNEQRIRLEQLMTDLGESEESQPEPRNPRNPGT